MKIPVSVHVLLQQDPLSHLPGKLAIYKHYRLQNLLPDQLLHPQLLPPASPHHLHVLCHAPHLVVQGNFPPVKYSFLLIKSLFQGPVGTVRKESMKNKKRVVKLVTSVTIMFAMSWLPIQLILLLKSFNQYEVTIFSILLQV